MRLIAIFILALCTLTYADELEIDSGNTHNMYIDTDLLYGFSHRFETKSGYIYDLSSFIAGWTAGYEFLNPNTLYACTEAGIAFGGYYKDYYRKQVDGLEKIGENIEHSLETKIKGFVGFTLEAEGLLLAPFSGIGEYSKRIKNDQITFAYVPTGIRAEYKFRNVSLGLKAFRMRYIHVWEDFDGRKLSGNISEPEKNYGYEISVPISFKHETAETYWYTSFEPYYLQLYPGSTFFGGRFSTIVHF